MTAEIINLRQVRKQRAREAAVAQAAENRVRFGRTREERTADEQSADKARRLIDSHQRELDDNAPDALPQHKPGTPPDAKEP